MKVAIIGMGASAYGSFLALEDFGEKIESIDIFSKNKNCIKKKKLFNKNTINLFYRKLKSDSFIPPKINIQTGDSDTAKIFYEDFEAMNLWGSSFLPFSKANLKANNYSLEDYSDAYARVGKPISISGDKRDSIETFFETTFTNERAVSIDENIQFMISKLNVLHNEYEFISGTARLALKHYDNSNKIDATECECSTNNCSVHKLFLSPEIKAYFDKSRLKTKIYHTTIVKINFEEKLIYLTNKKNNAITGKKYDVIIVCAGPKETVKLLNRSTNEKNFTISENKSFLFPIIATNLNFYKKSLNSFSLTNMISIVVSRKAKEQYFIQFYKVSDDLWRSFLPRIFWPFISFLKKTVYIGVLYLDDSDRVDYKIKFENEKMKIQLISKNSKSKVREIIKQTASLLKSRFLIFKNIHFQKRTSHHFGRLVVGNTHLSDWLDQRHIDRIIFCGGSNFKKLPSSSPTFTVMAEGYVKVKKLFSKIDQNPIK